MSAVFGGGGADRACSESTIACKAGRVPLLICRTDLDSLFRMLSVSGREVAGFDVKKAGVTGVHC